MFARTVSSPVRIFRSLRQGLLLSLALGALVAPTAQANNPRRDLGDAPDSTNNAGIVMSAYPGVVANFPTVFNGGAPHGPLHRIDSNTGFWLGPDVTAEIDADLLPDDEGFVNIDPPANNANNDAADDGVFNAAQPGIGLPVCGQTAFQYRITVAPGGAMQSRYTNVWFDYNRDGDWQDTFTCGGIQVSEWSVQNQLTNVGVSTTVMTQPFYSVTPQQGAIWMRITLAEQPVPAPADGRGPATGYEGGETEDYLLVWSDQMGKFICLDDQPGADMAD